MKPHTPQHIAIFTAVALGLLTGTTGMLLADDQPGPAPKKTAVTGGFDWSIVPANLPPYLLVGTDGDLYLRNLPLVGVFTVTGKGVTINGKLSVMLSGELDGTGTGVLWSAATVTTTINGVKTIIFQGSGTAETVGLASRGRISLKGRGSYAGMKLEFAFEETGQGNTDTYTLKGELSPAPRS